MRRRILVPLALGAAACGAVTVSAALSARTAAQDLQRAQTTLSEVRGGELSTDDAVQALRRARRDVDAAGARLGRWPVDVVAAVPVVGRSWDVGRAVARTASEVLTGAEVLAEGAGGVRAQAGGVDLTALADVRAALQGPVTRGRTALQELRSTSDALVPPLVSRGRADAVAALGPGVEALERADAGLAVAAGLGGASGPRSVLLVLQNNAELRGAGGYVSTFGTGRLDGGRLSLEPLRDVLSVSDPPKRARRVPAPAEYVEDYGFLSGDTTIWRLWNVTPHVPDAALVGSRIADALLGTAPDVVVLLDVPAMGALASLGGDAVELPDGSQVSPEELTEALLVDAYEDAGTDLASQERRRAQLRAAATAAVGRLLAGDVPAPELARTLSRLAAGRHLALWSARPDEQRTLVELGFAGAVEAPPGGDLSHVSINNLGGNKLDVYADRRVGVDVRLDRDRAVVVQRVSLTNRAPAGLVPYVAGNEEPGVMTELVELSLPPSATGVSATVDGRPWPGGTRTGASRQRLAIRTVLPRGATTVIEARYTLPVQDGDYLLRLLPQPLAEDAVLDLSVRPVDGQRLDRVRGAVLRDGAIVERAVPFRAQREVSVAVRPPDRTWQQRLRDFWNSPVEVG